MTTEAESVAKLATAATAGPTKPLLSGPGWGTFYLPNSDGPGQITTIDQTKRLTHPDRSSGIVTVYDPDSFMAALKVRNADHAAVAYADDVAKRLTVVLNDDEHGLPGWRDYRLALALRRTPEWAEWVASSNKPMGQETFAEMIEDRASMIVEPDAATMLEIAQTLVGHNNVAWASGTRLDNGARQIRWSEEVSGKAGDAGTLEIPARFIVSVPLFQGSAPTNVIAMFRFRLTAGMLTLHYKLLDVDCLEREAFSDLLSAVAAHDGAPTILLGPAPAES